MTCDEPIKLTLEDSLLTHLVRARDLAMRAGFHDTNTRIEQAIGMVMLEARGFRAHHEEGCSMRRV